MQNEAYSTVLRNALTEIKNICPDVQASFLFDKEGTIIAGDTESPEVPFEKTVNTMETLLDKAETIGGLDSLVINAQKGKVHVSCVNDMYLAMVTDKNIDMTYLQTVSRVLIPTVIKLLDNIITIPAPIELPPSRPSFAQLSRRVEQEEINAEEVEKAKDDTTDEEMAEETLEEEIEKPGRLSLSSTRAPPQELREPSNQLVVDTLSGLLVRGDTVQIDAEILNEWSDYYDGAQVNQVEIESFNGNSVVCKVKPIKDSKIEGKGIIRIPERACQELDVKKGEMVKVKPLMEEE
jgi:predicted regulator of Ras-like GTPase activity (Roadblock/LC7/MglB family)